ncbi:hypothetical protein ACFQY7_06470 [Actinomadura luteofluorescens]|uniref:hypothetical protein n=1 Tax=Actinomadura luteofluorescens TaxID=46163 RepID=UPI0036336E89
MRAVCASSSSSSFAVCASARAMACCSYAARSAGSSGIGGAMFGWSRDVFSQWPISALPAQRSCSRFPEMAKRSQSASVRGFCETGQSAFFSASSPYAVSTCAMSAALNTGWQTRTDCVVISPSWKIGTMGRCLMASAVQSTCSARGPVGTLPPSSSMSVRVICFTRPRRTTCSIRRSWSSSARETVAQRNAVGRSSAEMRSTVPAALSRSNRSGTDSAPMTASCRAMWSRTISSGRRSGIGCTVLRSMSHGARGMIQVSFAGSTPCSSSQRQASMPVLPAPTMTYRS